MESIYVILLIFIFCSLIVALILYTLYEQFKPQRSPTNQKNQTNISNLELIFTKGFNNDLCKKIYFDFDVENNTFKITSFYTRYSITGRTEKLDDDNQLLLYTEDNKVIGVVNSLNDLSNLNINIEDKLGNIANYKSLPTDRHIISKKYTYYVY